MEKPKLISKAQLARLLDTDVRANVVENAEPWAYMKWGAGEVPLYRIAIVAELQAAREVK